MPLDIAGWLNSLNFELVYKSGHTNIDADALSQMPGKLVLHRWLLKCVVLSLIMQNGMGICPVYLLILM